ncbi:MAG TPA: bacterial proteasome activator family protein [Acidimicrobiales bacterium]
MTDQSGTDQSGSGPEATTEAVLLEPGEHGSLTDTIKGDEAEGGAPPVVESVEQPAKVMRIGTMAKQLLDEVRNAPLDEAGRTRLREIHQQSIQELASALSPDLAAELDRMALPFDEAVVPSEAELRIAQAQLVGWLEGLFQGIQATLMAQQMAARAQLSEMRQPGLPAGRGRDDDGMPRPGAYL